MVNQMTKRRTKNEDAGLKHYFKPNQCMPRNTSGMLLCNLQFANTNPTTLSLNDHQIEIELFIYINYVRKSKLMFHKIAI